MKKKDNLRIVTFTGSIVPSTSLGYCLRGLQTFLTLLSLLSPCLQVLQWFCLPLATIEVLPLHFIVYNQLSSFYSSYLLPIIMPSNLQEVICWLVTPDFHHYELATTLLWQPVAQGSKDYLRVKPLTLSQKKCRSISSNKHPIFITQIDAPPSSLMDSTVSPKVKTTK